VKAVDLYVCHSITSCEVNGIREKSVLLPQFVFPEELKLYSELRKGAEDHDVIRIVAYTSFVTSPRLLASHHVLAS
jgi:glycerol-3-phosphate dehydrogenase